MPDGSRSLPSGRIRPGDADQVLIAGMICVATTLLDDHDMDMGLYLIERALPLVSASSRMADLTPAASEILAAAPHRRKRGEAALRWVHANIDLRRALARDAIRIARSKVEG